MKKLNECEFEHVTPESVGVKSSAVSAFIEEINEKGIGLQSFTFIRRDKIFAGCFWEPYSKDVPHVLYSMSKSVTSTAVGFCVDEGLLDLDDKVHTFFPEYKVRSIQNKAITVRMLLTMRSDKLITFLDNKGNTDWVKNFWSAPFFAPSDTLFNYISESTYMLSAIVSKVTGMSMIDYLYPRMFEPLGIEKPFWESDGKGNNAGGWGLYMKSEDVAKFFLPYMHGGKYKDGTQLIPEDWVKTATAKQTDTLREGVLDDIYGYGFQFWRTSYPNSFLANGLFGQRCVFLPEYDAMMVMNSGHAKDYEIMEVFWKHFPEAFQYGTLPENETEYDYLQQIIKSCHVKDLPSTPRNKEMEAKINNRTIECNTSEYVSVISVSLTQMLYRKPCVINTMRFGFSEDKATFYWREKDYENTICVGMNGEYGVSPIVLGDLHLTAYTKAAWQEDGSLKLWIRPIETAHVRQFTFIFNEDDTVKIVNEMQPTLDELAVYYVHFLGFPITKNELTDNIIKMAAKQIGVPIAEPDIKGKFED